MNAQCNFSLVVGKVCRFVGVGSGIVSLGLGVLSLTDILSPVLARLGFFCSFHGKTDIDFQ